MSTPFGLGQLGDAFNPDFGAFSANGRVCQKINTRAPPSPRAPATVPSREAPPTLSKRERQFLDIVFQLGKETAADVHAELPDAPTYTTVRGLEEKGHLIHEEDGPRYRYSAATPRQEAGVSLLSHVVRTFFDGSPSKAMAALLGSGVADADLARLEEIIRRARAAEE
jgi:predicted transcriptional regulator